MTWQALRPTCYGAQAMQSVTRRQRRLRDAADRMRNGEVAASVFQLRPEQEAVAQDFGLFLEEAAERIAGNDGPLGRIILPPRTGKTVVAGEMIGRTGLRATFVVPTRVLVNQTADLLSRQLGSVPIARYYGEHKELVETGVNVATYAILQRDMRRGDLPDPIREAELVFFDEAHHTLSPERLDLVRNGFRPGAVRVALTATPDWDASRTLCRVFPELIHEITLEEALDLGLLAPMRMWVAEVDVDGSSVELVAGDYDAFALGRVMSEAPFSHAVKLFRYRAMNRDKPALIACTSRQQAHDLRAYLDAERPDGSPPPAVILGDTSAADREQILDDFEAGAIDTLIQVGVLIEGWTSPRCKLLIDLAPSRSLVRSTQKYFRVMTRSGNREAHLYVLIPRGLREFPILPVDLFGPSLREYECGSLFGKPNSNSGSAASVRPVRPEIAGVRLQKRVVWRGSLVKPRLDRTDQDQVRAVIRSCPGFDPIHPCGVFQFRGLHFHHDLFTGRGDALMRWLRVAPLRKSYLRLLAWLFPEGASNYYVKTYDNAGDSSSCHHDALHLLSAIDDPVIDGNGGLAAGYRALSGVPDEPVITPEDALIRRQEGEQVAHLLWALPVHRRRQLVWQYGLLGQPAFKTDDVGFLEGVSRSLITAHHKRSLKDMRGWLQRNGSNELVIQATPRRRFTPPPFRCGGPGPGMWSGGLPAQRSSWRGFREPLDLDHTFEFFTALFAGLKWSDAILDAEPTCELAEDGTLYVLWRGRGNEQIDLRFRGYVLLDTNHRERPVDWHFCHYQRPVSHSEVMLMGSSGMWEAYHPYGHAAKRIRAVCDGFEKQRSATMRGY